MISYAYENLGTKNNSIRAQKILKEIYTKNSDIICDRARVPVNQLFPRAKNFKVDLYKT